MTTPASTPAAASTLSELLDQAAGDLNRLAPDLPALDWCVSADEVRGQVEPGTDDTEAAALLEAWAARLGLTFDPGWSQPGMREYWTIHNGQRLVIWGVTDAARWADETRAATMYETANTESRASTGRDEHTIKVEAIREAAAAQRQLATTSATRDGRYEHEQLADWLDEYAEAMDSAPQTTDNDAVGPVHEPVEAIRCAS